MRLNIIYLLVNNIEKSGALASLGRTSVRTTLSEARADDLVVS